MNKNTNLSRMTGGRALARGLVANGIDTVFGVPGVQMDALFDGFYHEREKLRVIPTRHEQGAAFMACGYAQASGRIGVFSVVPGLGLLNTLCAAATAEACSASVIALTGQVATPTIGRGLGMAHELRDQGAVARGVVDWVERVRHPSDASPILNAGISAIRDRRPRAGVLEVAPDQLSATALMPNPEPAQATDEILPDPDQIARAAKFIGDAQRPLILIGGGAIGSESEMMDLAIRTGAPVVPSYTAGGVFPSDHRQHCNGLVGQELWPDADVIIVVGKKFTTPVLGWGPTQAKIIRIEVDPDQIWRPIPPDVAIVAHAKAGLRALNAALSTAQFNVRPLPDNFEALRQEVEEKRARFEPIGAYASAIRRALPEDGILVGDVNQLSYYQWYFHPTNRPRTALFPGYQATLGYSVPAAIGAKIACPDKSVISVSGDGGFMFCSQELSTAMQQKAAVVFIVLNNGGYRNVQMIQDRSYGGRRIATDLHNPDFVSYAQSFGMEAARVSDPHTFAETLDRFIASDMPTLIEIEIEEVPFFWADVKVPASAGKPLF